MHNSPHGPDPDTPDSAPATPPEDTPQAARTIIRAPRRHARRRFLLGGAAALGLVATGASTWALNRFVIDHVEVDDVAAYEARNSSVTSSGASVNAESVSVTETGYSSSATSIETHQVTTGSGAQAVTYYVADVSLSHATTLRSAFAKNSYGTNITARPSEIAAQHNAVLAVNGDYYGFRTDGILIRNGTVYRDSGARDGMVFYTDGRAEVYDETSTDAQTLLAAGAWNTLSFGPALVKDAAVLPGIDSVEVDTNVGNHSIQGEQPRTAVGWVGTNHLVLVVVDGRDRGYSRGVTMTELAQIMVDLGCQAAYNLDGGGSSTLYLNGSVLNRPSNGGERATSDILYIANGS
ncbi:phosphodiester glycosidase family protein [Actinomyces sp. 2119]|uniref:phosphodiester glycosidase family protein n=1 Tax=Actinomyces sp. 2119 TaxID=2321393 RepID=UPI000E6C6B74|nr:phosphodiester glycosidase family protein [Actinomyces sp. 2119]RJF44039.1 phosphodiester glycosidase family protein [Actinomyces sp. 2119]